MTSDLLSRVVYSEPSEVVVITHSCFSSNTSRHVFYIPGNHELWTFKGGPNTMEKLNEVRTAGMHEH